MDVIDDDDDFTYVDLVDRVYELEAIQIRGEEPVVIGPDDRARLDMILGIEALVIELGTGGAIAVMMPHVTRMTLGMVEEDE